MTKRKLILGVQTVEDDGLLVHDKVYPEKQYVFTSPRGFYEWLCQQMGVNAKPDSPTHCGRVVVDALKLERLERIAIRALPYLRTAVATAAEHHALIKALKEYQQCYDSLSK